MAGKAIHSAVDLRSGADALKQLPDATGDATALSGKFKTDGTAISNTQVATKQSLPPEEWTGAAADAASAEIQKLGAKTTELGQAFFDASSPLEEWSTNLGNVRKKIETLQGDWDSAIKDYHDEVRAAGPDPSKQTFISTPGNPPNNDEAIATYNAAIKAAREKLRSAQEGFETTYRSYLNECSTYAQIAATQINNARRHIVSDEAGAAGRGAVGASLFPPDTMPTASGAAMWADAQDKAPEIAEDLKKQPKTAAELQAFNEKWGNLLGNPFYVAAVMQHVSLDDIYAASMDARSTVAVSSTDPAAPAFVFNKNLGTLLALSTGGSNLSGGMAKTQMAFDDLVSRGLVGQDGTAVSATVEKVLNDLKDTGRKTYSLPGYPASESNSLYGYDISSQLMGYAGRENPSLTLGAAFYKDSHGKSVFEDMVEWDYETKGSERAAERWGGNDSPTTLIPYDKQSRPEYGYLDPLQNIFTLSDTPDYFHGEDDGGVLWKAENQRLAALRGVLNSNTAFEISADYDGDGKATTEHMNMTRYLTGWRGYAATGADGYYDGGEALGDMVNDASKRTPKPVAVPDFTDNEKYPLGSQDPAYQHDQQLYNEWLADDKQRAQVAQNILLGYQDGLNHNGDEILGQDRFGNSNQRLRSWVGTIAAGRVDDLATMADRADGGTQDTANSPGKSGYSMMNMTDAQVNSFFSSKGVLTDLAFDKPAQITPGDELDPRNYEGGRLPALKAIGAEAWYQYRQDAQTLANGPYDGAGSAGDELRGANWRSKLELGTSGWQKLIAAVDGAPEQAGIKVDQAEIEQTKQTRAEIDYVISKIPTGSIKHGDLIKDGVVALFKDPLYKKYLPIDSDPALVTQKIQQELKTTQGLRDPAISAFMARDDWPNSYGLSKEEILREFAATQGLDPDAPLPAYADMTADQRSALFTYLTTTPDGAVGPRTDLKYLDKSLSEAVTNADGFVGRCDQRSQ